MKITLFAKKFESPKAWARNGDDVVKGFIIFDLVINKHVGFMFSTKLVNKTFNHRNPFKSIFAALESEAVGMLKYDALKDRVRYKNIWGEL